MLEAMWWWSSYVETSATPWHISTDFPHWSSCHIKQGTKQAMRSIPCYTGLDEFNVPWTPDQSEASLLLQVSWGSLELSNCSAIDPPQLAGWPQNFLMLASRQTRYWNVINCHMLKMQPLEYSSLRALFSSKASTSCKEFLLFARRLTHFKAPPTCP